MTTIGALIEGTGLGGTRSNVTEMLRFVESESLSIAVRVAIYVPSVAHESEILFVALPVPMPAGVCGLGAMVQPDARHVKLWILPSSVAVPLNAKPAVLAVI